MGILIGTIAKIFTGATLRQKPEHSIAGDAYLMQLGDLSATGSLNFDGMLLFRGAEYFPQSIVRPGDIVFRGRGAGINAAIMIETDKPVIAASPLMIIRPDLSKVDTDYLLYSLTNDQAHRHYAQYTRGIFAGIGKQDLEILEIELPNLITQQRIGKIKQLQLQENKLLTRYQRAKNMLVETFISTSTNQEKTT
jgi:hypothetical protein